VRLAGTGTGTVLSNSRFVFRLGIRPLSLGVLDHQSEESFGYQVGCDAMAIAPVAPEAQYLSVVEA